MITEDQLEQLAITWFQDTGWSYAHGPDIAPDGPAPERASYNDVVLKERLLAALKRINPQLPQAALADAAHIATTPVHTTLVRNNQQFQRHLIDGVPVEFVSSTHGSTGTTQRKRDHVRLIDFERVENNDYLVVNQFTIAGTKHPRRPDLILFVNGLPLGVIELKNPADENAEIWDAYTQLQTYKEQVEPLFVYNAALVVSDGFNSRVGSLTGTPEWFLPWRAVKHEDDNPPFEFDLETVVRGFFDRELLLDYLRFFILFENDGDRLIKKIAGYHQFHGVREAVRATVIASADTGAANMVSEPRATWGKRVEPGSRKAGVFWHTQGSGKSISMACYAGKLLQQREMHNPTLVVVTDRNDLDGQLFQQFSHAKDLLKQTPVQADSREELRAMLAERQSGGIIFTTVQKFGLKPGEKEHPMLCDRTNVVVISDEAHRSQYGSKGRLNTETGEYVFGFSKYMRDALPNASFIGFTGTPISGKDKDTRKVFGDYVSIYDIQDAVNDHATVPILYESRLAKLDVNQAAIEWLNAEVEDVVEDEESVVLRERTKSKWAELAKLVGSKPRLKEVAADLVKHFETRTATLDGKAMIVCMSRAICVDLFNELIALRPEWAGTVEHNGYTAEDGALRVIMSGNAMDDTALQPHLYTKQQRKRLEQRFKKADDPLKLVIVRDMWLTGFDAPSCHTMYVDKPMHDSNLMQAIARVNRVFKDKPGGLVVDYIGIAGELKKAIKDYTDAKGKGDPAERVEEAYKALLGKLGVVRDLFRGFDYSAYKTKPLPLLVPAVNHLVADVDRKKKFLDGMAAVNVAYSFCNNLDEVEPLHKEIAFFNALKAVIVKHTLVSTRLAVDQKNSLLKHILDNAVVAEGVTDVFALAGLDKPNIGLLSDAFLEEIRHLPSRNFAVELLARLLRDEIKAHTRTNLVQERKFTDRLLESLRKYHNRAIETAQVIEEMIAMAKEFASDLDRHAELGLNNDEIAFYDALAAKPEVLLAMGDYTLKKLATELTEKMRASTTVDWQHRESVRAAMRLMIKRLLKKYKYPPDGQDDAVALVIKQAEVLAEGWTN